MVWRVFLESQTFQHAVYEKYLKYLTGGHFYVNFHFLTECGKTVVLY